MNRYFIIKTFPAMALLFVVSFTSWAEEIESINKWNGKYHADDLRRFAPASNAISDDQSWNRLWSKWRANEPVPNIDFGKNMVVVATVRGPNQMLVSRLNLAADGNLRFLAASTKMAGSGFGYILVEIPRAGIKAINGMALPDFQDGPDRQPLEDSIQVVIVGTVRTGVMAIGGETTGATITSKGLTFELDFHRFRVRLESLDDKRLRVSGELNVRKGVEIKQRLIVKVADFRVLSGKDGEQNPGKPGGDAFQKITIQKSGGIAGLSITTTILPTGSVTREDKQRRITESFDIKPDVLAAIHDLVDSTDWSSVPKRTTTPNAADLFLYTVTIQTDRVYEMAIDDLALSKVPALQKLLQRINHVLN